MVLTTEQKAKLLECYFRNGQKVDDVWRYSIPECFADFQEEYPDLALEYSNFYPVLMNSLANFREIGSVGRKPGSGRRPTKRIPENINAVQQIIEGAPKISVRRVAQETNLSVGTCHCILKRNLQLHSYKIHVYQELLPIDFERRTQFCQWFLDNHNNDEAMDNIFFSDEAYFHLSGYVNSQNMRWWSAENPHYYVEQPLHPLKVGVWIAICRRRLIGPIFFDGSLNAERYRNEILDPFINQLDDYELQNAYFQQDGATPHTTNATIQYLQQFFDDRIISRHTDHPFPTRSCDLNICDIFAWPYMKNNIFATPVNNLEELRERITQKCQEINDSPAILQNVSAGFRKRVQLCLEANGQHFQQFL